MIEMGIFQCGGGVVVAEQPGDGGDRLAASERHRGVGVPEVMQPHIVQPGLGLQPPPEIHEGRGCEAAPFPARGKNPRVPPGKAVQNPAGRGGQPDRARSRLGVAQVQMALAIVGPFERQDFTTAAAGKKQQADGSDFHRTVMLMSR